MDIKKLKEELVKMPKFDTTAFFSKFKSTSVVTYWDEMNINGITGETFINGENN